MTRTARTPAAAREQQRVRDGIALLNRGTLPDWAGHTSDQQSGPYAGEAMHRWKLGHQLFHLQLARMCALLDQALDAVENRRWPTLTSLLDTLAELYDAATATMSYTAALPAGAYRDEVRPSMAPPARPGGFSGVLNAEHRAMIGLLRALRRALDAVPGPATDPAAEALREAAGRLAAAHRRNLDNHVLICGRFVPDGVSLLRKHLAVEAPEDTR